MGIKGSPATFFLHKISIGVGDILLDTEIGFLPRRGVLSTSYGIVGQRGFFEHFAVNFDYKKEEIELIIN